MNGQERLDGTPGAGEWTVRSLTGARGAYNGVRWWAQRLTKRLVSLGCGGTVVFPEGEGGEAEERRLEALRAAAARVAAGGEFGMAECHVWGKLGFEAAYRGVGGRSPAVEVDGVGQERMMAFAKALCEGAGEERAVVWEGVNCLQSVEGGEWEGDAGELWWVEKNKGVEGTKPKPVDGNRETVEKESRRCEEWVRRKGRVVVARARVEDWGAPEGVFRFAWISLRQRRGCGAMEMALRWTRKDGEDGTVAERVLLVGGASVDDVAVEVSGVPGAVCREVQVGEEVKGDRRWLEEVFGERPEGEGNGEWVLEEAGYVEPPRPSVFGRHDRYFPIREREECSGCCTGGASSGRQGKSGEVAKRHQVSEARDSVSEKRTCDEQKDEEAGRREVAVGTLGKGAPDALGPTRRRRMGAVGANRLVLSGREDGSARPAASLGRSCGPFAEYGPGLLTGLVRSRGAGTLSARTECDDFHASADAVGH